MELTPKIKHPAGEPRREPPAAKPPPGGRRIWPVNNGSHVVREFIRAAGRLTTSIAASW